MKRIKILFFFIINILVFGQSSYSRIDCENVFFSINSNTRMDVKFLNTEIYNSLLKDSIQKDKPQKIENVELNKIFQKKYPNKITNRCINSQIYKNGEIRKISYCDEKTKIKLVDKKFDFYIFKIDAFEIDNYLLFNSKTQIVYTVSNFPQILENGNIVIDAGYEYGGNYIINYYIFKNENMKYFEFSGPYQLQNVKFIKSYNSNPKVIGDFIQYDYKEISTNEYGKKVYEYDKEKYCRKIIMIN